MLEIGTIQNLTVVKKVDFGVYLAERFGIFSGGNGDCHAMILRFHGGESGRPCQNKTNQK